MKRASLVVKKWCVYEIIIYKIGWNNLQSIVFSIFLKHAIYYQHVALVTDCFTPTFEEKGVTDGNLLETSVVVNAMQ